MWSADEGRLCGGLCVRPVASSAFVADLGKGVCGGADANAGDAPD